MADPTLFCCAPGCIEKVRNAGLCASHYRNQRAGKPLASRQNIPPSLPGEAWEPIEGTDDCYHVSSLGRIRSMPRIDQAGRQLRGRIMVLSNHPGGYKYFAVPYGNSRRRRVVHQLVAEAFIGPRPAGLHVCHNDGDPSNNRADNLRYDTPSENMHDIVRHGRHRGARKTHCIRGHEFAIHARWNAKHRRRECQECRRTRRRVPR